MIRCAEVSPAELPTLGGRASQGCGWALPITSGAVSPSAWLFVLWLGLGHAIMSLCFWGCLEGGLARLGWMQPGSARLCQGRRLQHRRNAE